MKNLTLYARNEFKGVMIVCPHCHMGARHDPDDIGDAIKERKPIECVMCSKSFSISVQAVPVAATLSGLYNCEVCGLEKCVTPGVCDDCLAPPTEFEINQYAGGDPDSADLMKES